MVRSLAALVLLFASAAHAAPKPARIDVPRATKAPSIDGKVSSAEWMNAARVPLMTDGHALLLHDGTYLYVAFVGRRGGVASVCTMGPNDRVRVLHASSQLGTALFEKAVPKWKLTQGFNFTDADSGPSPQARQQRKAYLAKEGWLANTAFPGLLQREFQIRLGNRTEMPIVLSLMSWITREEFDLDVWPESVVDGCAELDLAGGWTDREYTFAPETWGLAVMQ
ncbi:MAG TPA: hypothetical protein VF911_19505 [Thermoanaerobaculia bacterium]|jgi:hypothetical protein